MCFKTSVSNARSASATWVGDFDTRSTEFPNFAVNICHSLMVLTTFDNKSLMPFLESALFRLDAQNSPPYWCVLLLCVGLFQAVALAVGTRRKTYLLRLYASGAAATVSLCILLVLMSGPQPFLVTVRYSIPFGAMLFSMASCYVRHGDKKAQDDFVNSASGASY